MKKDILILGIETSCDETSAAVVKNGRVIFSNIVSSQVDLHEKYGGVVPEIASRKHVELIMPVIDQALLHAGKRLEDMDAIAVTYGPGLSGALLTGVSAAKAIAFALDKPLIGVNHIAGHIAANYLSQDPPEPPFVCLVVSGGHTDIIFVKDYDNFEIMGRTRDDAAGEAFDKTARVLGLGYPGGPAIDKAAREGNPDFISFPRVYFSDSLDFSFSGLKTSVINYVNTLRQKEQNVLVADIAAGFQQAVVDVLAENSIKAAMIKNTQKIALAGGVSANSMLRKHLSGKAKQLNLSVFIPEIIFCTDNAAMISAAAFHEYTKGRFSDYSLNAVPDLGLC